ncbi:MAG: 50S ribosomal protein L1 [Thermoprotei archaeon]
MSFVKNETLIKNIKDMNSKLTKRNFKQSIELIINLRDVDLKKPENRIRETVLLPHEIPGRKVKIFIAAERDVAIKARDAGADLVLGKAELEQLSGNKKELKKIAREYDFFLAQPDLMPTVGRVLGQYLGPRGKAPEVLPPNANISEIISRLRKSVRIRLKDQPVIGTVIGKEGMPDEQIAENIRAVLAALEKKFKFPQNFRSIYIKGTMSEPVKFYIKEFEKR